jgi:hypothetical protein
MPKRTTPPGRGGARPGAGRKPLAEGIQSIVWKARLTPEQLDKLERLGGAAWLRDRIDRARDPE